MRKEIQGCVRSNVRINVHHHYPRNPRSIKAKSVRKAHICPRKCPPGCPGKCRGQTWASASGAAGTRDSPDSSFGNGACVRVLCSMWRSQKRTLTLMDQLRHLEALEPPVAVVQGNQPFRFTRGSSFRGDFSPVCVSVF